MTSSHLMTIKLTYNPLYFCQLNQGEFSMAEKITVEVNGKKVTRTVEPRLLLVHFLRDELVSCQV